jgi:hypothetical protein
MSTREAFTEGAMLRAILVGAIAVLAGCATAPKTAPTASSAVAQPSRPPCAPEATRIPDKTCGPGRTWDQDDLKSTGQAESGAALRMLDPSVIVQH